MPTYPGFIYSSGPYELQRSSATVASATIDVGDALEEDSGQLVAAASNERVGHVALEAKASSDSTTNPVQTIITYNGRTKFIFVREAGTLAAADEHTLKDLNSADGIACDTSTNGDFYIIRRLSADHGIGMFAHLPNMNEAHA